MSNDKMNRRSFVKAAAFAGAGLAFFRGLPQRTLAQSKLAGTAWQIEGDYFETCSCDYLCPCLPSGGAAQPTKGYCDAATVFHIDQGRYGTTILDDLNFVIVAHLPDAAAKGNWSVCVITDSRANPDQEAALTAIASGKAGGPVAGLAPAIGKFLGTQSQPIQFHQDGMSRSVMVPGVLDQAVEGVPGADPNMPMYLDNVSWIPNTRLALAHATRTHLNFFGIKLDDISGKNNGHFAPFSWKAS
jgi:hypothetical protein